MANFESWIKEILIPKIFIKIQTENVKNRVLLPVKLGDITVQLLKSETFMLTMIYKVKVNFMYKDGSSGVQDLVVKKTPQLPLDELECCQFSSLYHNEVLAYQQLLPMLEASKKYPKYFYSHFKSDQCVLVLSDFGVQGWRMSTALVNLSLEHILLSVKELGRFHGTFYATKHESPQTFKKIIDSLVESRFTHDPTGVYTEVIKHGTGRTIKIARESQNDLGMSSDFLEKLAKAFQNAFAYWREKAKPIEPYAVLCHGDYLRNNLAFKYDEKDKELPVDVLMFDFQTLRYSSPMIDLSVFLANSTGVDVRSSNFDRIFQCYHDSLVEQYCTEIGVGQNDIPDFMSHENFIKEFAKYYIYGIQIASTFLMNLHEPDDLDIEEFLKSQEEADLSKEMYTRGGETVDRELRALIKELYELSVKYNVDVFSVN